MSPGSASQAGLPRLPLGFLQGAGTVCHLLFQAPADGLQPAGAGQDGQDDQPGRGTGHLQRAAREEPDDDTADDAGDDAGLRRDSARLRDPDAQRQRHHEHDERRERVGGERARAGRGKG